MPRAEEKAADDTACTAPELGNAARIERPGGHHFDGEYQPVADMILRGLTSRARSY
jgi:type IV secretory pathway VirJ component